jgi:hypothetical protein
MDKVHKPSNYYVMFIVLLLLLLVHRIHVSLVYFFKIFLVKYPVLNVMVYQLVVTYHIITVSRIPEFKLHILQMETHHSFLQFQWNVVYLTLFYFSNLPSLKIRSG